MPNKIKLNIKRGEYSVLKKYIKFGNKKNKLKIGENHSVRIFGFCRSFNELSFQVHFTDLIETHKFLIDKNIKANKHVYIEEEEMEDLLVHLAKTNDLDAIDYLIDNNFLCDKNKCDYESTYFYILITTACKVSKKYVVIYLTKRFTISKDTLYDMLKISCKIGNFEIAKMLLNNYDYFEMDLDLNEIVIITKNKDILKILDKQGAMTKYEILYSSCKYHDMSRIEYLLDECGFKTSDLNKILKKIKNNNKFEESNKRVAKLLIKHGADKSI